jgi:hypothetical protein
MGIVQENAMCVLWFCETKSVIKTQRRYRTQYGTDLPSDNAIRRWLKQFQDTGTVVAAIETVTPQMLDILRATILQITDIPSAVLFYFFPV